VHHEFSYDKFNEYYDRIYRLEASEYGKFPPIIGDYIKDKIPGIENTTRLACDLKAANISYIPEDNPEGLKSIEVSLHSADSTLFNIFTFPFIRGNSRTALKDPFTIVLTESTVKKLFDKEDPVGKTIEWANNRFRVTGVIKDVKNSHVDIEALCSFESIEKMNPDYNLNNVSSSGWLWSATYLLLGEEVDPDPITKKINQVLAEINDGTLISVKFDKFTIRQLKDVYFRGNTALLPQQFGRYGNLNIVRTFIAIAVFILVLACINYINLTTARASLRSKEVAMKKVVGSSRFLLRYQFILESVLVTLISFLLAFTLVQGFMLQFNRLALVNIRIADLYSIEIIGISILGVLSIGIISGMYPALYLTTIKSISLMRGVSIKGSGGAIFRKALLIFQFSISVLLIIGIITNMRQLNFARNYDLGFDKNYILQIPTPAIFDDQKNAFDPLHTKFVKRETIRERLLQNPKILKVSFAAGSPGEEPAQSPTFEIDGIEHTCQMIWIDPDYLNLMGMEIIDGRGLSWDIEGDRLGTGDIPRYIVNETASRQFYKESPIGKLLTLKGPNSESYQYEVIGIVRDFHFRSIHHDIPPIFMGWSRPWYLMHINISSNDIPSTIAFIENEWRNVYDTAPFRYSFLDDKFDLQYKSDEQGAKIIGYFTILAIIIACMGLFALSSFMAACRTKEIGIRKALGASSGRIFIMLSLEFVKWVLIAAIIACPIAWIMMKKWLEGFAYHINLRMDILILAIMIALVVAIVTIAWQSLKTALANPVEALRYE
jgi:putative ABC transport system permease protein